MNLRVIGLAVKAGLWHTEPQALLMRVSIINDDEKTAYAIASGLGPEASLPLGSTQAGDGLNRCVPRF